MHIELALLALFTFAYGLMPERISKLPMSGPVVFVLVGLALGLMGLGWFQDDVSRGEFHALVDLTLGLILFIDAANANLPELRRYWQLRRECWGSACR